MNEFKKEKTREEKLEHAKRKQENLNKDIAKQRKLEQSLNSDMNKKRQKQKELKRKEEKQGRRIVSFAIFLLLILFVLVLYFQKPEFFKPGYIKEWINKEKILKNAKPSEQRAEMVHNEIVKRNGNFNRYLTSGSKDASSFEVILPAQDFIQYLKDKEIYIEQIDEREGNTLYIGTRSFFIEDFKVIDENRYLKKQRTKMANEMIDINQEKPNIILTGEGVLIINNKIIVQMNADGKGANFDGFSDEYGNPIVIGYDVLDGDITDNIEIENFKPETWNYDETHKLKYKLTNSRGKTTERYIEVICPPEISSSKLKENSNTNKIKEDNKETRK